jgi:hypothetical protein
LPKRIDKSMECNGYAGLPVRLACGREKGLLGAENGSPKGKPNRQDRKGGG